MNQALPVLTTALLVALFAGLCAPAAWAEAPDRTVTESERRIERRGDQVSVFSGGIHVPANTVQRGNVVCIGGSVRIEGRVTGDVVVILGQLELSGSVGGSLAGVLADMELTDAEVSRELVSVLSGLKLERSTIHHELVNILGALDRDGLTELKDQLVNIGFGGKWFPSMGSLLFWLRLFVKFLVFVLLVVICLLAPERIRRIGEEAPVRYLPAFFMGVLGYLAYLVILALLTVTFVGVFPAWLGFQVMKWMGIAAIFYAVGHRLGRAFGASFSVLGAVLLVFAFYTAVTLLPSLAGMSLLFFLMTAALWTVFFVLVQIPAVGLVILTRFGRPPIEPALAGPPTPVEPAAPVPPATP